MQVYAIFSNLLFSRSKSSQGRIIRQKRRRHMLDLLFNLSIADLCVGLITIPLNLALESGFANYKNPFICLGTTAIGNGKLKIMID